MRTLFPLVLAALLTLPVGAVASPDHQDIIRNAVSVDAAVSDIVAVLEKQGFRIEAIIDHAAAAEGVGLVLRPTQVVMFRKPFLDVRLIRRRQPSAIDLPFKILVYEDADGRIRLKSNDVGYLIDRHEINLRDVALQYIDSIMDQFGLNDKGIRMVVSVQSVADTVSTLKTLLQDAGFRIPLEIDFSRDRKKMRPTTLLVFGNPNVGTQLMQNSQEVGLDLPQKFLVFEDREGKVRILYNDPYFIAQRAGIQGLETLLGNIAAALQNFADTAASP